MKLASEWLPRDMWRHEAAGRAEIPLWNATCWDPGLSQLDISPNIWCHSSKTIVWPFHTPLKVLMGKEWHHALPIRAETPVWNATCWDPGLSQLDISPNIWCHSSKTIVWPFHTPLKVLMDKEWHHAHSIRAEILVWNATCWDPDLASLDMNVKNHLLNIAVFLWL
mgnify:CR=1 FL=1